MKKLMNIFESKRNLAGLIILSGLIYTTYNIQENSGRIKKITNFEGGIQTCFTRVNQTYTANILGDTSSNYLTQNFQNLTEECFAEGILSVENSFKSELTGAAKLLSNLASNVHWFHEDILTPAGTKSMVKSSESRDVASRFEKIETTKDEILEVTDRFKTEITNSLNQQKNIFYVSATLLVILMLLEYMSLTKRRLLNSAREKDALLELADNGGATSVKVGEIIRTALEQNELLNCSKLFSNFHSHALMERGKNKLALENLITPASTVTAVTSTSSKKSAEAVNKTIDQMWADDSIGVSVDKKDMNFESINLEQVSSQVVDLLAEKLFSQSVQLDMNIAESLYVKGKTEELEQTLYHLLAYAINSTQSDNGEKNISIFAHRLGDIVAFDLIHSGAGFDEATLKHRAGLETSPGQIDLDLMICQSLLEEMNAKIQLDNKIDQTGRIVGGRVKIIFRTGKVENQGKLVDLKKGSKKEILASINS